MRASKHSGFGALCREGGVRFKLWAPRAERIELVLDQPSGDGAGPGEEPFDLPGRLPATGAPVLAAAPARVLPMKAVGDGYYEAFVPGLEPGALYRYRVDGEAIWPDPASRFQPEGVHGPSMVVDPGRFVWTDDAWRGVPQKELVVYELHIGTFTPEGTFDAARRKLPYLKELGVTAVELMPVADFPGRWSWGYDQAALFAPSRAYGTPDELRALVAEAHRLGLAVFLDVIFNHLGPDGAYAAAFGYFLTERHHTPWGNAINLDDEHAEQVRLFLLENAIHWLVEYHIDGLRLDATQALRDDSPKHFLAELVDASGVVAGPRRYLFAEDDRNLDRLVRPGLEGGYGLSGVWVDDFHYLVRHLVAGDYEGYFSDYAGATTKDLADTIRQGWFFTGQYSRFRNAHRGTSPAGIPPERFVFYLQNHDQVGNRPFGNRLSDDVSPSVYRAASAVLLFAPQLPFLFMGQEWAARTPFRFFTDHRPELGRLVSEGRKREFGYFSGYREPDVPDPQDPATFRHSKLDWSEPDRPEHARMLRFYRDLLALRRRLARSCRVGSPVEGGLLLERGRHALLVALKGGMTMALPPGYRVLFHSEQPEYAHPGHSLVLGGGDVYFPVPAAVVMEKE